MPFQMLLSKQLLLGPGMVMYFMMTMLVQEDSLVGYMITVKFNRHRLPEEGTVVATGKQMPDIICLYMCKWHLRC